MGFKYGQIGNEGFFPPRAFTLVVSLVGSLCHLNIKLVTSLDELHIYLACNLFVIILFFSTWHFLQSNGFFIHLFLYWLLLLFPFNWKYIPCRSGTSYYFTPVFLISQRQSRNTGLRTKEVHCAPGISLTSLLESRPYPISPCLLTRPSLHLSLVLLNSLSSAVSPLYLRCIPSHSLWYGFQHHAQQDPPSCSQKILQFSVTLLFSWQEFFCIISTLCWGWRIWVGPPSLCISLATLTHL